MKRRICIVVSSSALAIMAALSSPGVLAQSELALPAFVEGAGRTLVMLGGGTFGAVAFAPHAKILANTFRVIRLQTLNLERDQRQQPLPPRYSVTTESAAMTSALDHLNIRGAVDVVGWSFGGVVALDFALNHPDRVRTLALFEPPAFWAVSPEELRTMPDLQRMVELSRELVPGARPNG